MRKCYYFFSKPYFYSPHIRYIIEFETFLWQAAWDDKTVTDKDTPRKIRRADGRGRRLIP